MQLDLAAIELEDGFSRDVTRLVHFGTGNIELSLKNMDDLAKAQPLLRRAYKGS